MAKVYSYIIISAPLKQLDGIFFLQQRNTLIPLLLLGSLFSLHIYVPL
jgi:hypothetical protein